MYGGGCRTNTSSNPKLVTNYTDHEMQEKHNDGKPVQTSNIQNGIKLNYTEESYSWPDQNYLFHPTPTNVYSIPQYASKYSIPQYRSSYSIPRYPSDPHPYPNFPFLSSSPSSSSYSSRNSSNSSTTSRSS